MNRDKVVGRVEKFARLASSNFPSEAASAALRACQIIRDFDLVIMERESINRLVDRIKELEQQIERQHAVHPKEPVNHGGRGPVLIHAKYGGWCDYCGRRFEPGEQVFWCSGEGTWHLDCND